MINCIGCILNTFLVYDYIKMTSGLNVKNYTKIIAIVTLHNSRYCVRSFIDSSNRSKKR